MVYNGKGRRRTDARSRDDEARSVQEIVMASGAVLDRRRSRWVGLAALALALMALAAPSLAQAYIYWTNFSTPDTIGRANLDGTGPDQNFITGASGPVGVAVNSTYIYWANTSTYTIGRANLDGTSPDQNFITGANVPRDVAVDSTYIYWTNFGTPNTIGRANLDGTSPNQSFITVSGGLTGVAVNSTYIYWTKVNVDTIGRANLDGTSPNQSFITGASRPRGVAVNSAYVYWVNYTANTIGRAGLDGTGPNQSFITTSSYPYGVALDTTDPTFSVAPTSKAFGSQDIDAGSTATQTFTVQNTGSADLAITAVSLAGADPTQFVKSNDTCVTTLIPAATCTVQAAFDPTTTGAKTADLRFTDNASGSPHTAGLSGTGTAAPTFSPAPISPAPGSPAPTTPEIPEDIVPVRTMTVKKSGALSIDVACPAQRTQACQGDLEIKERTGNTSKAGVAFMAFSAPAPGPVAGVANKKRKKKPAVLGSASYAVSLGLKANIRMKLNKRGMKLLRKRGRLPVTLTATSSVPGIPAIAPVKTTLVLRGKKKKGK